MTASLTHQFIELARLARERALTVSSIQRQVAYAALANAIDALPLDSLAGDYSL